MTPQEAGWEPLAICWKCRRLVPCSQVAAHACIPPSAPEDVWRLTDKGVFAVAQLQAARRAARIAAGISL